MQGARMGALFFWGETHFRQAENTEKGRPSRTPAFLDNLNQGGFPDLIGPLMKPRTLEIVVRGLRFDL